MTSAFLLPLLLKAWPIILGFIGWLGARFYYMRKGAAKERAKIDAADKRVRDIGDEVENDIHALTPEQRRQRLRDLAGG